MNDNCVCVYIYRYIYIHRYRCQICVHGEEVYGATLFSTKMSFCLFLGNFRFRVKAYSIWAFQAKMILCVSILVSFTNWSSRDLVTLAGSSPGSYDRDKKHVDL